MLQILAVVGMAFEDEHGFQALQATLASGNDHGSRRNAPYWTVHGNGSTVSAFNAGIVVSWHSSVLPKFLVLGQRSQWIRKRARGEASR